jgi:hypothetical protein
LEVLVVRVTLTSLKANKQNRSNTTGTMTTEMPWSEAQQKRLLQEKTTIDKFFRDTKWQGQNRRDTTWYELYVFL